MCGIPNDPKYVILLMMLVSASLSACSDEPATGRSSSPASAAVTDACALLTAAEIEAATGITAGPAKDVSRSRLAMCNWPTADGSNPAFLTLTIGPSQNYASYDDAMRRWSESAADMGFPFEAGDYQEVDGVGDVGAWMADAGTLQAHTGTRMVQVMLEVAEGRDKLEAASELARQVNARLP